MKNLIVLIGFLTLVSCDEKVRYVTPTPTERVVEVPVPGEEVEVVVEKEVFVAQDFENVYLFRNGGFIEMVASKDDEVTILNSGFNLVVRNKGNNTYANFPRVTGENLEIIDNTISIARNVNYGSGSQYDLERDDNGQNITGSRYTVMKYTLLEDLTVKLSITIYSGKQNNNLNFIIFKRTLRSF